MKTEIKDCVYIHTIDAFTTKAVLNRLATLLFDVKYQLSGLAKTSTN